MKAEDLINKEFDKFIEIVNNDENLIKQAKSNKFDDFKKSSLFSKLFNEWKVAMFEKYAINGKEVYEKESNYMMSNLCDIVGKTFLTI